MSYRHCVRRQHGTPRWCTRSRAAALLLVLLALVAVVPRVRAAAPPVRLEVVPWGPHALPPVLTPADSMPPRSIYPDTLAEAVRPHLVAAFRGTSPTVDGDLGDWTLVRWNDLAGAAALTRGTWSGPADFTLRFAITWNEAGVWFAARLLDDRMAPGIPPLRRLESVTLACGSNAPFVDYTWMGGARRFRVRGDGAVDAWTDVRNRRIEPFDAAALGVRAAARRDAGAGRLEFELFVPWMALYPALPHPVAALLANVVVDDVDDDAEKRAVWSVRQTEQGASPVWARLDLERGPARGWFVTTGTRHPESVAEWVVFPWADVAAASVAVRPLSGAFARWPRARAALTGHGPFILRLQGVPAGTAAWPAERAFALEMQLAGDGARRFDWTLPVDSPCLDPLLDALRADTLVASPGVFPIVPDVEVRVAAARRATANIGTWKERRLHATGVLALRAATWSAADQQLDEAALLQGALRADAAAVRARLRTRWPALSAAGLPLDTPLLRGYRSVVDGSAQPYVLVVPASATAPCPLLVVLHDVGENVLSPLSSTAVAAHAATRGWLLLCPQGRGDIGYQGAGERDVIDAIAAVRAALPVDGTRLYITGSGMGGTGSWLLALRHPDLFAGASIVSGYADLNQTDIFESLHYQPAERAWYDAHDPLRLVVPSMVTAFRVAHAERDPVVSPVHARILQERFATLHEKLEFRLAPGGDHGPRFFDDDLAAGVDFLAHTQRPQDGRADLQRFGASGSPIADVWGRGPFAIVWGTHGTLPDGGDAADAKENPRDDYATAQRLATAWWSRYGGVARVLPDSMVTPAMQATMNLVLVGDATSNSLLSRWAGRLPVRYESDAFLVAGKAFPSAKYGIFFAATNPDYPDRTLVVCTALGGRLAVFPRPPLDFGAGYAIVSDALGLVETGTFAAAP